MRPMPIIILGSARKQSDTKAFVDLVFQGLDHTLMDLLDFNISPYKYDHEYPANDDFLKLIEEVLKHDIIVFATPVYWYAMSGQMKIFFDRFTDLVTIHKPLGRQLKGKSIFLLAVGAEEKLPYGFLTPFKLTAGYLGMKYKASVYFSTKYNGKEQKLILKNKFIKKLRKQ